MTTEELFNLIISKPKWYAGIESKKGKYHNPQSANRIKDRYKRGVLSNDIIEKILNSHGYYKNEVVWVKRLNK